MSEKKISGLEVKVDRPLATEALKLQARLMRAAGGLAEKLPSILASRREGASEQERAKADADALTAITGIFERLSPDEYAGLVGDIIAMAKVKRASGQYDQLDLDGDLSDKLGAIVPITTFVLREIFGDFFSGALVSGGPSLAGKG